MSSPEVAPSTETGARLLRDRVEAEAHVGLVCFKHGPPRLVGVELEWTVHHADDPSRPLNSDHLTSALGSHAPPTLNTDSPHQPLPNGSVITVEPGGQVEISSQPQPSLAGLLDATSADIAYLVALLSAANLTLGAQGTDPYRPPVRLLDVPRYAAMETAFNRLGSDGITMMCSTAGLQVCLDAGEQSRVPVRWAAVHALGPVLTAAFANSPELVGQRTGWASSRMRAVWGTDPVRSQPGPVDGDPVASWARYVLDTPVICHRRPGSRWDTPPGISFADWIGGAFGSAPSTADLDYHLSTMFNPVRPQGYLEVRYLDTQPGGDWVVPVAVLVALFHSESTVDAVLEVTAPGADRWVQAAQCGLDDPVLASIAPKVFDLAVRALPELGLPEATVTRVVRSLDGILSRRSRVELREGVR